MTNPATAAMNTIIAAPPVEIFPDPGMIVRQQLFHRTYHDVLVEQHSDPITSRIEAVQIVRHHENGEAEAVVQSFDEFVVVGGADRVEAGGRLIQEQQLWVEGERP